VEPRCRPCPRRSANPCRADFATTPLTAEAFLASPASQPFRHLWVGEVGGQMISVVMVDDLSRADALATLRGAAEGLPGVRWVDRTADFSSCWATTAS
jgi:predicted exporter